MRLEYLDVEIDILLIHESVKELTKNNQLVKNFIEFFSEYIIELIINIINLVINAIDLKLIINVIELDSNVRELDLNIVELDLNAIRYLFNFLEVFN